MFNEVGVRKKTLKKLDIFMKSLISKILFIFTLSTFLVSCNFMQQLEQKAAQVNRYEQVAYDLAKENKLLQTDIDQLKYQIKTLEAQNNFLQIKLDNKLAERKIASIENKIYDKNDPVKYDIYKWSPDQLLAIGEMEFKSKNFIKSAQFFNTFMTKYPNHKFVTDQVLFQAGVSAYESGKYYNWSSEYLSKLVKEYPTSKYYRGAKLWLALLDLKMGKNDRFFKTVEEFRLKYRNTPEWKIISGHYYEIKAKYKN